MCFKHITIVEDGTNKYLNTPRKAAYEVIDFNFQQSGYSLIRALHGMNSELAAQHYLYDNPREFHVICEIALPQYKYEQFEHKKYVRNPAIQAKIEEENNLGI